MAGSGVGADSANLEAVVRDVVERTVGPVQAVTRLTGGVMNAAFEVRTSSHDPVVARVAERPSPHFEAERRTLDLLAPHDLPTPHVIALDHRTVEDRVRSTIVASKLPGRPLGVLEQLHDSADGVVVELGRLLGGVHLATIETGTSSHPGWLAGLLDDDAWMRHGAAIAGVDPAAVDHAAEVVRSCPRPTGPRAFIHNDFKSGNILVANGRVTGIVDFEFTSFDDPARDLAFWTFWHGDHAGGLLRRGYEAATDPPPDLDERLALYRLEIALSYLQWFKSRGVWPGGAALVTRNLLDASALLA